jgi:hypothetical protein
MNAEASRLADNRRAERGRLGDCLAVLVEHCIDRKAGQRGQRRRMKGILRAAIQNLALVGDTLPAKG